MKEELDQINRDFLRFYEEKGYKREPDVKISSGIDKTVTYIGSGISVLKPLFLNGKIDSKGNYIKQKAIRTQALKKIYDSSEMLPFSSFFDAMCVLTKYNKLEELVVDSFEFFEKKLQIKPTDIMLRINSSDIDLIDSIKQIDENIKIEYDTQPGKYYKHKYGLSDKGIFGRNMNFAFLDKKDGKYKDVGNFIIIESDEKKYGVELALSPQAVLMRRDGIQTSIETSYIADILTLDTVEKMKYAECLIVVANLHREGITYIKDSRYPVYLYKKYLNALKYWQEKLKISSATTMLDMERYLEMEYNNEFEYNKDQKFICEDEIER